jgi:hypothetical protein
MRLRDCPVLIDETFIVERIGSPARVIVTVLGGAHEDAEEQLFDYDGGQRRGAELVEYLRGKTLRVGDVVTIAETHRPTAAFHSGPTTLTLVAIEARRVASFVIASDPPVDPRFGKVDPEAGVMRVDARDLRVVTMTLERPAFLWGNREFVGDRELSAKPLIGRIRVKTELIDLDLKP